MARMEFSSPASAELGREDAVEIGCRLLEAAGTPRPELRRVVADAQNQGAFRKAQRALLGQRWSEAEADQLVRLVRIGTFTES